MIKALCEFVDDSSSSEATDLSSLAAIGLAKIQKKNHFRLSRDEFLTRISRLWLNTKNQHLIKFAGHKTGETGDKLLFVCHITSCTHAISG